MIAAYCRQTAPAENAVIAKRFCDPTPSGGDGLVEDATYAVNPPAAGRRTGAGAQTWPGRNAAHSDGPGRIVETGTRVGATIVEVAVT